MIYIRRSDGVYGTFDGMTQDVIAAMLQAQGLTCTFIDQATYQAAVATR